MADTPTAKKQISGPIWLGGVVLAYWFVDAA